MTTSRFRRYGAPSASAVRKFLHGRFEPETGRAGEPCERRDSNDRWKPHRKAESRPAREAGRAVPITWRCGFPRRRAVRGAACFWQIPVGEFPNGIAPRVSAVRKLCRAALVCVFLGAAGAVLPAQTV